MFINRINPYHAIVKLCFYSIVASWHCWRHCHMSVQCNGTEMTDQFCHYYEEAGRQVCKTKLSLWAQKYILCHYFSLCLCITDTLPSCHHNLEFFCTSQCSAANMHIIHPSNNNTFHPHISASAEARLIYPAQSHYNQPIGGTCGPQGSKYVILHSLFIWGSAAHHAGCFNLVPTGWDPQLIWKYKLGEESLSPSAPALRGARVAIAFVCCTRTILNGLVWPKISKQTVWESLEFGNSGCLGWDTIAGWVVQTFGAHHLQGSCEPYSSWASWPLRMRALHSLKTTPQTAASHPRRQESSFTLL